MAYHFPAGTKAYYSTTFAGAKTVTGITNASPAVATSVAHGYTDGDPLLFSAFSGWTQPTSMFMAQALALAPRKRCPGGLNFRKF